MAAPRQLAGRALLPLRLLVVVAATVSIVLGSILWWAWSRERTRLDEEQRTRAARTAGWAVTLITQRLERGDTVLRAIAASGSVQEALLSHNDRALNSALQAYRAEFGSTMVVIDDDHGRPLAWSSPLAVLQLGIDPESVEGRVRSELAIAATGLTVRSVRPVEVDGHAVGTVRGAVTLGRLFVQQLSNDLEAPVALYVGGKAVHHTFRESPPEALLDGPIALGGETFDLAFKRADRLGTDVVVAVGIGRAEIEEAARRTRLFLAALGAGGLALTLAAIGGYLGLASAQVRLARQRDEALRRSRLTMDRFEGLRAVVHDIKAPVAGIQLRSEALLEQGVSAPARDALAQIADTCERINLYLVNVLTAAEVEESPMRAEREVVLIPGLIADVVERLEPLAARKQITVETESNDGLRPFQGDPALLERALWNLTANALAATPTGGNVVVFARVDDDQLVIGVRDSGGGFRDFPPEQAFSRHRPGVKHGSVKAGSHGLGLYIVSRIAEAHGGTAVAENLPGGGARVGLRLPFSN